MQMPSRARAGTAHEARLAYRAGPARQTGPRAVLVHRAGHVGRPGPARLVIRANRAGPDRAGPDRARAGSGRARPVGQLYRWSSCCCISGSRMTMSCTSKHCHLHLHLLFPCSNVCLHKVQIHFRMNRPLGSGFVPFCVWLVGTCT